VIKERLKGRYEEELIEKILEDRKILNQKEL